MLLMNLFYFHFQPVSLAFILFYLHLIGASIINISLVQLYFPLINIYISISSFRFSIYNNTMNIFYLVGKIIIALHVQIKALFET